MYVVYRLQAQGTVAHPYVYTSAWDVARKTYRADGIRGFYKGLGPTLFKVKKKYIYIYKEKMGLLTKPKR